LGPQEHLTRCEARLAGETASLAEARGALAQARGHSQELYTQTESTLACERAQRDSEATLLQGELDRLHTDLSQAPPPPSPLPLRAHGWHFPACAAPGHLGSPESGLDGPQLNAL
jgi:hypothetical protein